MPTLDFIDIGDVLNSGYSRATISALDTETDTCTLDNGETALIFYH